MSATEAAACCARFYEQDWVRAVLGDSFHPGGVELSARLVAALALPSDARVLDVACGVGTTALMMARRFGLDPVGCDASAPNLAVARDRSAEEPPVLVEFVPGTAEALPFPDGTFDAVVCECAVSTFADQPRAVAEFARVLKPGGAVGISDMVVEGELPADVAGLVAPWTCLSGARSAVETQRLFLDAGLRAVGYADESAALRELVVDLKRKLLTAGLARSVARVPGLEALDVAALRDLLNRAAALADAGTVQYARFWFAKGRPRFAAVPAEPPCDPATGCCAREPRRG
jgi:SAM-dependent methyltransferase